MRCSSPFPPIPALLVLLGIVSAQSAERQVLRNHVPAAVVNSSPAGSSSHWGRLDLAIGLPLRNQDSLRRLLQEIYDPASPNYRHYLTPEQFAERFGPTEQDYEAVINFAQLHGLTVTGKYPNRTLLDVRGMAANVERAFHVQLK